MQRLLTCLLGISIIFCSLNLQGQDFSEFAKARSISPKGDTLNYRILWPANYDKNQKYPLVLFLHGGGERGNDNEKQLTHGAKLFLDADFRADHPCIVMIPQCPTDSYWAAATIDRSVQPFDIQVDYSKGVPRPLEHSVQLVQQFIKEGRVDKKQVYITGLSMGGMGTYQAVATYPKLFAAAATICGVGDPAKYTKKAAKVPFRIFHGDADQVVTVEGSRNMYRRLQDLGAKVVTYTEYPGVNHNSWDNAFKEPDFLDWFFQYKK